MPDRYQDRVRKAFPEPHDGDQIEKFLEMVMVATNEHAATARRTIHLVLGLMAAYLLLSTAEISKFSIGPVEINRTSQLTVFITTAVAYFAMHLVSDLNEWSRITDVWTATLRLWNPKIVDEDLELLLAPSMPTYFHVMRPSPPDDNAFMHDKLLSSVSTVLGSLVMLTPVGFEAWAFYDLFRDRGATDFLVWLNLVCTLVFLGFAFAFTAADAG